MLNNTKVTAETMPILGAILSLMLLAVSVIMVIKTGYLQDEGIVLPLKFESIIWLGIPISFISIAVFYILERKIEKENSVPGKVVISLFVLLLTAQLVVVTGWVLANSYSKSHDIIQSNYVSNISLEELKASFETNENERIIYIGRRSCPQCLNFVIELKELVREKKLDIEYYSTEFDRETRQDELYSFFEEKGIDSVPMVLIQGTDGVTIKKFEGDHIIDDMREYFS